MNYSFIGEQNQNTQDHSKWMSQNNKSQPQHQPKYRHNYQNKFEPNQINPTDNSRNSRPENTRNKLNNRINMYKNVQNNKGTGFSNNNTIYSSKMSSDKINNEILSRKFNIPQSNMMSDNRILSNDEKKKINFNSYDNLNINDSRSSFNDRLSKIRPLAATMSFPVQKRIPYLDMKPSNTRDTYIQKTEKTVSNYQELLQNFDQPLSKRI